MAENPYSDNRDKVSNEEYLQKWLLHPTFKDINERMTALRDRVKKLEQVIQERQLGKFITLLEQIHDEAYSEGFSEGEGCGLNANY